MRPLLAFVISVFAACTPHSNPVVVPALDSKQDAAVTRLRVEIDEASFEKAQVTVGNPKSIAAYYPVDARRAVRDTLANTLGTESESVQYPRVILRLLDFSIDREFSGEGFNTTRASVETLIAIRADFQGEPSGPLETTTIIARGEGTVAGYGGTIDKQIPSAISASVTDALRKASGDFRAEAARRVAVP